MEHAPWIGDQYQTGVEGQKLLLFGFSHYGWYDDGSDDEQFTEYVMRRWVLQGDIPFFNAISSYFGFDRSRDFYAKVAFANTLPFSVGDEDKKFSDGEEAAITMVPDRVRRIISQIDPDKVIVFTAKGWRVFPAFDDRSSDGQLEVIGRKPIGYGGYSRRGQGYALAYGLRHPMMAPWQMMRDSVMAVMAHRE